MSGIKHWRLQRISAGILLFLIPWLLYELILLYHSGGLKSDIISAWLADPFRGMVILVTLTASLYHGQLGVEVIIEDYVPCPNKQKMTIRISCGALILCWLFLCFAVVSNFYWY